MPTSSSPALSLPRLAPHGANDRALPGGCCCSHPAPRAPLWPGQRLGWAEPRGSCCTGRAARPRHPDLAPVPVLGQHPANPGSPEPASRCKPAAANPPVPAQPRLSCALAAKASKLPRKAPAEGMAGATSAYCFYSPPPRGEKNQKIAYGQRLYPLASKRRERGMERTLALSHLLKVTDWKQSRTCA